jgi:hypothetical protein
MKHAKTRGNIFRKEMIFHFPPICSKTNERFISIPAHRHGIRSLFITFWSFPTDLKNQLWQYHVGIEASTWEWWLGWQYHVGIEAFTWEWWLGWQYHVGIEAFTWEWWLGELR